MTGKSHDMNSHTARIVGGVYILACVVLLGACVSQLERARSAPFQLAPHE